MTYRKTVTALLHDSIHDAQQRARAGLAAHCYQTRSRLITTMTEVRHGTDDAPARLVMTALLERMPR